MNLCRIQIRRSWPICWITIMMGILCEAITKVMHRVEGSYALGIMFKDHPDELYAVRKDSPLIVGKTKGGCIIASDVPAVLKYTRDVYFIENEEIVRMRKRCNAVFQCR